MSAWSYIGIPYVTDEVPNEIMPTLPNDPTGNGNRWPDYDPCTISVPTITGSDPNQYVVDSVSGNDGTAGNGGNGTISNPRQTLPNLSVGTWTFASGTQVFLVAGSTFLSGSDIILNSSGTSLSPCWIVGVDASGNVLPPQSALAPVFVGDKFFLGGTHIIIDAVKYSNTAKFRVKFGSSSSSLFFKYGTIRNCEFDGQGGSSATATLGGSGVDETDTTEFILIYNNEIHSLGDWNRQDANGTDKHGVQFTSYGRNIWIIDNEIYHCEGDSIQNSTSNYNDAIYTKRLHYVYCAGNLMYENYENAIDNKNVFHCISSQNTIHTFHNDFKPANNTAFILSNDAEGWLSSYEWAIANTIYDAGTGIKMAPTAAETVDDPLAAVPVQTSGQKSYAIGNLIYDVEKGIVADGRGVNPTGIMTRTWYEEIHSSLNTISCGIQQFDQVRGNNNLSEPGKIRIEGDLLYNNGSGTPDVDVNLLNKLGQTNELLYSLVDRAAGSGNADISSGNLDVNTGNILDSDPLFTNEAGDDYTTQSSSPARDVPGFSTTPEEVTLFNTLYGIDITVDLNGQTRPQGTLWDAGVYEGEKAPPTMTNPDLTTTQPQAALDIIKADCDTLNALGVGTSIITASDLTNALNTTAGEIAVQYQNQVNIKTDNSLTAVLIVPSGDFVNQFQTLYDNNVAIEAVI